MAVEVELEIVTGPEAFRLVRRLVGQHHRHHPAPRLWRFGVLARKRGVLVGVATVNNAVAQELAKRDIWEVTRVCTFGTSRQRWGAASALYQAAEAEAKRRGAAGICSYTLQTETGASLRAAGWAPVAEVRGRDWQDAPRRRKHGIQLGLPWQRRPPTSDKVRWAPACWDEGAV